MNKSTIFVLTCFVLAQLLLICIIDPKSLTLLSKQDGAKSNRRLQSEPNRWVLPKELVEKRYDECKDTTVTRTGGFCLTKRDVVGGNSNVDIRLANYLEREVFAGKTVVDLGAGLGHYGKIYRRKSSKVAGWVGYDGAMNVGHVTNGLVKFMDLTQPDAADERLCAAGDYVLSLEVGEHIPPQFMENYLRNIRCHAREGAVISWGNQAGHMHVNNLPSETVIALMDKWGFEVDEKLTRKAKLAATYKYFQNNVIVYKLKKNM